MYNTSYEEYMKTVLGYTPNCMQDTFVNDDYYIMQNNTYRIEDEKLKSLYPEIYIKVYPLVCEECSRNNMPITNEILEQMTDNVINKIQIDLKIQTNTSVDTKKEDIRNLNSINTKRQEVNTRPIDRASKNSILRDLIKILILRELLSGNKNRPQFPPRPPISGPGGMRPQFSPIGTRPQF